MTQSLFIAYTILRVSLGLNIFLHGWVRWKAGRTAFADALVKDFHQTVINTRAVKTFGSLLPIAETLVGICLVLGLFTEITIITGSVLMLLLITGKSIKSDWQTVSLQMIYVLLYVLLEAGLAFNTLSADFFLS